MSENTPDAAEVEALCDLLHIGFKPGVVAASFPGFQVTAKRILASDWLAAHDAALTAKVAEQIEGALVELEANMDLWGGCSHEWNALAVVRGAIARAAAQAGDER